MLRPCGATGPFVPRCAARSPFAGATSATAEFVEEIVCHRIRRCFRSCVMVMAVGAYASKALFAAGSLDMVGGRQSLPSDTTVTLAYPLVVDPLSFCRGLRRHADRWPALFV